MSCTLNLSGVVLLTLAYVGVWMSFVHSMLARWGIVKSTSSLAITPSNLGCLLYGQLEVVSIGFRCFSLPGRMIGNLMTGHVVLHLVTSIWWISLESLALVIMSSVQVVMGTLEMTLSWIQVLVWVLLTITLETSLEPWKTNPDPPEG